MADITINELDSLIKSVEKNLKGIVARGSDEKVAIERLSSGIPVLDKILGGGYVRGVNHIFSGEWSSGKTYIAMVAMKQVQKEGGTAVLIDIEKAYDPHWYTLVGVDIDKLIVIRPNYGEEALDAVLECLKANVDLIVIDSLAGLLPMDEMEGSMEDKQMGSQARLINKALRKFIPANTKTVILAINQLRASIGSMYHPGLTETMPGGKGQTFFSHLILSISRKGSLTKRVDRKGNETIEFESSGSDKKREGQKVGFIIHCFTSKSKISPPFQHCEIPLNFISGQLDNLAALIDVAIDEGIIEQKGAWYYYADKTLQGKNGVYEYFLEHSDEADALKVRTLGA